MLDYSIYDILNTIQYHMRLTWFMCVRAHTQTRAKAVPCHKAMPSVGESVCMVVGDGIVQSESCAVRYWMRYVLPLYH